MDQNTAKIVLKNKTYEVRSGIPLHKVFKQLDLPLNAYLAVREGVLITEDEMVKSGDRIKIMAVISGG
jgi:sulfur carrier protein ThiS